MLDRVKEQERQSYSELQQELKSLKTLLLSSRDSAMSNAGPPSIFSQIGKKPSIPAWQLAATTSSPISITPSSSTSSAIPFSNGTQDTKDIEKEGEPV